MKRTRSRAALTALLAALLTFSPALAAPAQTDLLTINGETEQGQPASEQLPAETQNSQDMPADESTYREQPSASSQSPRLADGQPGRGQIQDLAAYWEQAGYPADVSYACEAGGEVKDDGKIYHYWEIGLVGADETRRQQILDLASPQCLVTFYSCTFSHSQKNQAYQALLSLKEQDANIRQVIFTRNTESVVVGVPEGLEKDYARLLIHQMGLGAVVSVTDERHILTKDSTRIDRGGAAQAETKGKESALAALPGLALGMAGLSQGLAADPSGPANPAPAALPLTLLGGCLSLALAAGLWLGKRRRVRLMQASHGTETHAAPLTRRQTARLIRSAAHSPSPGLLPEILKQTEGKE